MWRIQSPLPYHLATPQWCRFAPSIGSVQGPHPALPPEGEGNNRLDQDEPVLGISGGMARFATEGSGRRLLRNPYPAFADAARDGLELGVHFEFREDVLHVRPDRVGRHPQRGSDGIIVVAER